MDKKTKEVLLQLVEARKVMHNANQALSDALSEKMYKLSMAKDVDGLEKMMEELPECAFRYTIFLEIQALKSENLDKSKERRFIVVYKEHGGWKLVTRELADYRHAFKMKAQYELDFNKKAVMIDLKEHFE